MSLSCHGLIRLITPAVVSYRNNKGWIVVKFEAVSDDPNNIRFPQSTYVCEMNIPESNEAIVSELLPGTICNIKLGDVISPPEYKNRFGKIDINFKQFEILDI